MADESTNEVIRLEVEMDLVPDWSNALEAIGRRYGEAMELGVEGEKLIVRIEVVAERKRELMAAIRHTWDRFVTHRKATGRW